MTITHAQNADILRESYGRTRDLNFYVAVQTLLVHVELTNTVEPCSPAFRSDNSFFLNPSMRYLDVSCLFSLQVAILTLKVSSDKQVLFF